MIKLILTLNNFSFNDENYLQIAGTAMGTRMAPSYACLFMGRFEKLYVHTYRLQPKVWLRYIDDIFLIWTHGKDELHSFITYLNNAHPTIKFTSEISETSVPFLDISISLKEGLLSTDLYSKPTDTHSYLLHNSSHSKACLNAIPYSQFLRVRRICSTEFLFLKRAQEMAFYFQQRNYPHTLVHNALLRAWRLDRTVLLSNNTTLVPDAKPLVLITTHHPHGNPLIPIIRYNWDLLSKNSSTRWLFDQGFKTGLRRTPNLRDLLVRAKLNSSKKASTPKAPTRLHTCGRATCRYCNRINHSGKLLSPFDKSVWNTLINVNCNSNNLIYAIQCKQCSLLYVGQTSNAIKNRFNNHFYDITKKPTTFVSKHYNLTNHSRLDDVEIFILDFIKTPSGSPASKQERLRKEAMWQHKLHSLAPHGLNTLDENRVKYKH